MKKTRKPDYSEETEKSIRLDMADLNSFVDRPDTHRAIEASRIELVAAGGENECTQTFHFREGLFHSPCRKIQNVDRSRNPTDGQPLSIW